MKLRWYARPAAFTVLLVAYFAAGKLGLTLALVNPSATAVWPPTGIALAAFLILGNRVWPAILLGAFLVNATTSGSVATSIGISVGNTLEGLVGACLVRRFANGRHAFDRAADIFKFTALAALLSTMVSATLGVVSLCLGGFATWAQFWSIWTTWWLGDATGDLVVAPAVLLWSVKFRWRWSWNRRKVVEAVCLLLCSIFVAWFVFAGPSPSATGNYPLGFLCVPFLLWAAFRFGPREAVAAIVLLSAIAIGGTLHGFGPFRRENENESLLLLQAFMGVLAVTTAALAAVVSERRRVEKSLALLESAVQNAVEGVVLLVAEPPGSEPRVTFASEGFRRVTGREPAAVQGETLQILDISEGDRNVAESLRQALREGQRFFGEAVARRADGSPYSLEMDITPTPADGGQPAHWAAILRDVSERRAQLMALERQATYDFLTGLPNRVLFQDRLDRGILSARRDGVPLAVFVMDLDRFKQVNDTFGHAGGDLTLKQLGPRLRGALRMIDTVARLGGDEFAFLLPTVGDDAGAALMAEKILQALQKPFDVEGQRASVAASIGIALCPQHGAEATTLLRRADEAMYIAKKSRQGFALYSSGEDARLPAAPRPTPTGR